MSLEEVAEEIRKVEKNIQNYTKELKECEYAKVIEQMKQIENEENFDQKIIHNIIFELESQSDYLLQLKTRYNELYKKISNIQLKCNGIIYI